MKLNKPELVDELTDYTRNLFFKVKRKHGIEESNRITWRPDQIGPIVFGYSKDAEQFTVVFDATIAHKFDKKTKKAILDSIAKTISEAYDVLSLKDIKESMA